MATLTTDSKARKNTPIYSGVLKYFPRAIAEISRLSRDANEKHNPGEPMHWAREKSNDHPDCLMRHLLDAGTIDPEDNHRHTTKVAWRALAMLELELEAGETKPPERRWIRKLLPTHRYTIEDGRVMITASTGFKSRSFDYPDVRSFDKAVSEGEFTPE
jgi:hypothetical protein